MYYRSFKNILYLVSHVQTSAASDLFLLSLLFDVGIVFKKSKYILYTVFSKLWYRPTQNLILHKIYFKKKKKKVQQLYG